MNDTQQLIIECLEVVERGWNKDSALTKAEYFAAVLCGKSDLVHHPNVRLKMMNLMEEPNETT